MGPNEWEEGEVRESDDKRARESVRECDYVDPDSVNSVHLLHTLKLCRKARDC